MAVTTRRLSAEEYFALPPGPRFTQLIDGEVVVNQPNLRHQRITLELAQLLWAWCRAESGRGEPGIPVDVHLDDHNVFAPDVWWVAEARRPARDALRIVGPPDLVAEVRSPSTWRCDVGTKRATYERAGVAELWLVDTEADSVLVFRRSLASVPQFDVALELAAGDILTTPLLPGLAIDLTELFDR
ncbi:MAG TPA: Uma2 family endonuclease [Acidimicrobiales bacterium]|nr:Uma2 family endonuclease [Acidimicrobiales bacterium]